MLLLLLLLLCVVCVCLEMGGGSFLLLLFVNELMYYDVQPPHFPEGVDEYNDPHNYH